MDNLEKFIKENREEFDPELPEGLWDKIESETKTGRRKWVKPLSIAAGILLLVSISLVFFNTGDQENRTTAGEPETEKQETDRPIDLNEISPEYAEIEQHYTVMVNDKMQELNRLDPDPELLDEMSELEEEYQKLKEELGNGGDDEQIVQAMIENYRIKLRILEDILDHLKDIQNENIEIEI